MASAVRTSTWSGPAIGVAVGRQGGAQGPRVTGGPGERDGPGGELRDAVRVLGEGQPDGQPGHQVHAQRGFVVAERRQRLVQQLVLLPVDEPHLEAAQAGREPQRRLGQAAGVPGPRARSAASR